MVATKTDLPRSLSPLSPRQDPPASWAQEATTSAPKRVRSPGSLCPLSACQSVSDLLSNIFIETDEITEGNGEHGVFGGGKGIDSQQILKACHQDCKA